MQNQKIKAFWSFQVIIHLLSNCILYMYPTPANNWINKYCSHQNNYHRCNKTFHNFLQMITTADGIKFSNVTCTQIIKRYV